MPALPEAGVAAYVQQRFGDAAWSTGLAALLYQRTQGHPFFFITMLDAFVRQGHLVASPTGWAFHGELDTVRLGVPDSVRQLIERQLEDVQPGEQAVLAAASVAGAEFSAAAVVFDTSEWRGRRSWWTAAVRFTERFKWIPLR